MNCYDCSVGGGSSPAVAVCSRCGASVCRDHVRIRVDDVVRHSSTGFARVVGPPGRSLRCATCNDAGSGPAGAQA